MKKYDIVVPKPDPKDPEKTYWKNVGTLVEFEPTQEKPERGFIMELNMFPTTTFKVFAQKPKVQGTSTNAPQIVNEGVDAPPPQDFDETIPY